MKWFVVFSKHLNLVGPGYNTSVRGTQDTVVHCLSVANNKGAQCSCD